MHLIYLADFENGEFIIQSKQILQIEKWKMFDITIEQFSKNTLKALKVSQFGLFLNVYILLKILCNIPITSMNVEKSFSTLERLET